MKVARLAFALAVVCLMAGSVLAQTEGDNQGGGRGGRGGRGAGGFGGDAVGMFERLSTAVQKLDLTADQKEKFEALKKDYAPKFKAIREKSDKILTDDQKAAIKAAREAKPEDRRAAFQKVRDAMAKMTDDQKKQMEPVAKEGRTLMEEARTKITNILTDDQKAKLREAMGGRRGGGRRGGGNGGAEQSQRST